MNYRREIDGLRALAVLAVILFHAGFQTFGGGFVGVDVFFVISGYLITSLILAELDQGKFSLINFYERRARRILPALFLVMFVCLPFAWLWLLPNDLKDFAQSLVAVPVFASNILFWRETGYFGTAEALKPLLHTWSLAVEEQYYLLFPLFLMLTWPLGKRWILSLTLLIFVASLAAAQWGSNVAPEANFYLLPTRGWELLVGSFVAFYRYQHPDKTDNGRIAEWGGVIGIALVVYAVFGFDNQTPFPSLYALVPTVGAALIILCATPNTFLGKLLASGILVGIGLVSYGAYLWHYPIFSFLRYRALEPLSFSVLVAAMLMTFVLAYASWKFVELPFRNRSNFTRRAVFSFALIGSLIFVGVGYAGIKMSAEVAADALPGQLVLPKKVMLLGDSHAGHLAYGLRQVFGANLVARAFEGCIPFYNVDRYDSRHLRGECVRHINRELAIFESDPDLGLLILSTMGPVYLDGTSVGEKGVARITGLGVELIDDNSVRDRWAVFETGMRKTLERLNARHDKKVIFVLDVPELGLEPRQCRAPQDSVEVLGTRFGWGKPTYDNCRIGRLEFDTRTRRYHQLVKSVVQDFPSIHLFDPTALFCDEQWCYGSKDGANLYRDADHLSDFGSVYVAEHLAMIIAAMK